MSGNDYPPPGQHTITDFRPGQEHAASNDYPPPGQHTITDFKPKQDHVEPSMPPHNVLPGKQTIPQQNVPLGKQTMPQPQPQQNIPTGQQPTPQMQNVQQMQYVQQMPQQQYVMGGQAMPPQQQYYQQPQQCYQQPQQNYQQPQQMSGQPMLHYYQPVPGQQFLGNGGQPMPGQPMPSPMVGQPMATPMNLQLQPWTTGLFDCAHDMENSIITFFCPCITFGQIAELTDRGMTTCTSAGLIYGLLLYLTGCHWIYSWMYRTKMRQAYSLAEDPCHDFLARNIAN